MALKEQTCVPVAKGAPPLSPIETRELLAQVPLWQADADFKHLQREFAFKNFHETMSFVNAVAFIAHRQNHHPDLQIGYSRCRVQYSTHAVNGLSHNDFVCAAKIDDLLAD